MTLPEKIKLITDFIDTKLNGDIYRLQFGCDIADSDGLSEKYIADIGDGSHLVLSSEGNLYRYHGRIVRSAVVGRGVTLEDVLACVPIEVEFHTNVYGDLFTIVSDFKIEGRDPLLADCCHWLLRTPLHKQPESVIDFLLDLFYPIMTIKS